MARIAQTCSFCGKSANEVKRLINGPGVAICDECVKVCEEMLKDDPAMQEDTTDMLPAGDQGVHGPVRHRSG
jgi:ATP-dependent Clp protease ATP-binding subunit ClpX